MQFSGSDVFAILAMFVSLGSVFYAKKSAEASYLANRVNLHQPHTAIFQALFDFRHLFVEMMDLHPNEEEIQQFYKNVVLPATLYFPAALIKEMYRVYARAFSLYKDVERAEGSGSASMK